MAIGDAIQALLFEVHAELEQAGERVKASEPGESYERARFEFDVLLGIHKRLAAVVKRTAEELRERAALNTEQAALLDRLVAVNTGLQADLDYLTDLVPKLQDQRAELQETVHMLRQQFEDMEAVAQQAADSVYALLAARMAENYWTARQLVSQKP